MTLRNGATDHDVALWVLSSALLSSEAMTLRVFLSTQPFNAVH